MKSIFIGLAGALALFASAHAQDREMCWDREFSQSLRFDVEVGWAEPNPLDPNPTIITPIVDEERLLTALRSLEGNWKTPTTIWPKTAVQIRIYDRGVLRCQAIYTRDAMFAQDKDLNGFLRRSLAVSEYFDLDEALGLE